MSIGAESDHYQAKADFSDVYDQRDPRPYYRTLGALGYEIPAHGAEVFNRLLDDMGGRDGKTVLDVCCGYGPNAALINHEVDLAELYKHYANMESVADDLVPEIDRRWFSERSRPDAVTTVGLDVAGNAVRYATSVGLLDRGIVANLETDPPDSEAIEAFSQVDLVTVTGGIGYIGASTFRAILESSGDELPWVAALNLRWIDFTPIAESLGDLGMVTERLDGYCVPQRRFAHDAERQAALAGLNDRGLDPAEEISLDSHCAELYLVRPAEAARQTPIDQIRRSLTAA